MKTATVQLVPIGWVKSPEKKSRKGSFENVFSEIIIREDLTGHLEGLEEFSHLEVIYFMHLADPQKGLLPKVKHPMGDERNPSVGRFATRSPNRPNRIGITLCQIISIEKNVIRVKGLDALDGSPVLDIKGPTKLYHALANDMRFPKWIEIRNT